MAKKHREIEVRVIDEAVYLCENEATVREVAKRFGISKSTVHKDLTERLPEIMSQLSSSVEVILQKNKAERHIRGGNATKAKFTKK